MVIESHLKFSPTPVHMFRPSRSTGNATGYLNSISRYTNFRKYWPKILQPRARGVAWLRNVLLLELLLLLMLLLLLSETPDKLLFF